MCASATHKLSSIIIDGQTGRKEWGFEPGPLWQQSDTLTNCLRRLKSLTLVEYQLFPTVSARWRPNIRFQCKNGWYKGCWIISFPTFHSFKKTCIIGFQVLTIGKTLAWNRFSIVCCCNVSMIYFLYFSFEKHIPV